MTQPQFKTRQLQVVTDLRVFAPFYGANPKVMQRLLTGEQDGQKVDFPRLPITVSQAEQVRLGRLGEDGDRKELRNTYVDTATLVLPNPESDAVMTVPEHPLVYLLSGNTQLEGRNLPITKDMYEASRELECSFEFTPEQANALRNKPYSEPKLRRAAWESWNGGDTELTDAYVADIERSIGYKFDESAMGIWIPQSKGGRLLYVNWVDGDRSDAYGIIDLGNGNGRLLGVAAEPQDVSKKVEDAKTWVAQFEGLEKKL